MKRFMLLATVCIVNWAVTGDMARADGPTCDDNRCATGCESICEEHGAPAIGSQCCTSSDPVFCDCICGDFGPPFPDLCHE